MNLQSLPTALTCARLFAAPVIAGLILWADGAVFTMGPASAAVIFACALGLFALAAITDAADGVLARRLGAASTLGAALDHAADKALTACCLTALSVTVFSRDLIVASILLIARDVVVGGLREGLALGGRALAVIGSGKLKTTLILFAIGAALLEHAILLAGPAPAWLTILDAFTRLTLWSGLGLSLWSAIAYARAAISKPPSPERVNPSDRN